jgi:hypothetical protein
MARCQLRSPSPPRPPLASGCASASGERWPGLASVDVRFRGRFAYVDGELHTGEVLPLCRLRYAGSASLWGFAIYLASRDGYEDSILPTGPPIGAPEEALDCACGLYLADPSAWQEHPHQPAPDHARTSIGQYLACPRR